MRGDALRVQRAKLMANDIERGKLSADRDGVAEAVRACFPAHVLDEDLREELITETILELKHRGYEGPPRRARKKSRPAVLAGEALLRAGARLYRRTPASTAADVYRTLVAKHKLGVSFGTWIQDVADEAKSLAASGADLSKPLPRAESGRRAAPRRRKPTPRPPKRAPRPAPSREPVVPPSPPSPPESPMHGSTTKRERESLVGKAIVDPAAEVIRKNPDWTSATVHAELQKTYEVEMSVASFVGSGYFRSAREAAGVPSRGSRPKSKSAGAKKRAARKAPPKKPKAASRNGTKPAAPETKRPSEETKGPIDETKAPVHETVIQLERGGHRLEGRRKGSSITLSFEADCDRALIGLVLDFVSQDAT